MISDNHSSKILTLQNQSPAVRLALVLGVIFFFLFFASMFNGLTESMIWWGSLGALANFAVSAFIARKDLKTAIRAAVAFGSPPLLLAILGIGDLLTWHKPLAVFFWMLVSGAAMVSGLIGVFMMWYFTPEES